MRRINSRITADNYTFDTVKEFIYLGSAVTTKNDVSLEIKRRIMPEVIKKKMLSVKGKKANERFTIV